MKRLVITESEKQRILGMHQSAANKLNLLEQSGNQTLDRILQQNNDAAWRFIDGVTAAEKAGTAGTVDENAIVNLVYGIKTVDLYITILHNIRENVENNYCNVTAYAIKNMFVNKLTFGVDRGYAISIANYLNKLCEASTKSYGGAAGDPKKGGFDFECSEGFYNGRHPAGCKGGFKTKSTKILGSEINFGGDYK